MTSRLPNYMYAQILCSNTNQDIDLRMGAESIHGPGSPVLKNDLRVSLALRGEGTWSGVTECLKKVRRVKDSGW